MPQRLKPPSYLNIICFLPSASLENISNRPAPHSSLYINENFQIFSSLPPPLGPVYTRVNIALYLHLGKNHLSILSGETSLGCFSQTPTPLLKKRQPPK